MVSVGGVLGYLGIGRGGVLGAGAEGGLDATADLAQHDPFLAHFMVGQKAAGQEGVAAVVDAEVGEGGAAAAGDEEHQPGPVALYRGIVVGLEPHRPAQELNDGVQRAGHADAVDGAAHRPIGPFQDALADVEGRSFGHSDIRTTGFEKCLGGW